MHSQETDLASKYTFGGKELQTELDLGWSDFGTRCLDSWSGKWLGVDILAEAKPFMSPYSYGLGNPVRFSDPTGMIEENQDGLMSVNTDLWGGGSNQSFMDQSAGDAKGRAAKTQNEQAGHFKTLDTYLVNDADLGNKQITTITDYIASIYSDSGFDGIFNFKILTPEEGKETWTGSFDLFLALVNVKQGSNYSKIALSDLTFNAITRGWSERSEKWSSYFNLSYYDGNNINNKLYDIAYTISHEFLHQILMKADYHVNNMSSVFNSQYYNSQHVNYPLNLNTAAGMLGLEEELKRGYCSGSSCHHILPEQVNLMSKFLSNK